MSEIIASSLAICFGCAATYYGADSFSVTFSYVKAAVLSVLIYIPIQFTWTCFLYPLYFSPLRKLPQAPVRNPIIELKVTSNTPVASWGMEKLLQTHKPSSDLGIHG
jgi:hypothetical protein